MRVSLVSLCILSTLVYLKYAPAPYVWISLSWFIALLDSAISADSSSAKAVWFNLSIVILTLGSFEAYFWINGKPVRHEGSYTQGYFTTHDILGYSPRKNNRVSSRTYYRDELIYDVVYTIDSDGLRISPPHKSDNNVKCVLFFGGSLTFGEGVNDTETLPYRTGIKTNGRYRIYNFGFHGYGPHQMLAALDHQIVENTIKCNPRHLIYLAIPAHISRAAGLEAWDKHGPRYILTDDGGVIGKGHFDDSKKASNYTPIEKMVFQLQKSLIYERIFGKPRSVGKDDMKLFIGIVQAASRIFTARYKGSEFHVIIWDRKNGNGGSWKEWFSFEWGESNSTVMNIWKGLKGKGIDVHLVSDILPGFDEKGSQYEISQRDRHPNALAYDMIAEYVAKQLISK